MEIDDQSGRDESRLLGWVSASLLVLGAASLTISILWHPPENALVAPVIREFFTQLWPFTVTTAFALLIYERRLRKSFIAEMRRISGPSIVKALLPRQVLYTLLSHIYGEQPENRDVTAGVLGGAGEKPNGADLTISSSTTVYYRLQNAGAGQYRLTSTVRYAFTHPVSDARFALFALGSADLRDSIILGCDLPLFDYWYFPSDEQFERSSETVRKSAKMKVLYLDADGIRRQSSEFVAPMQKVDPKYWPDYLSFFRTDLGALRRRDPSNFLNKLSIYSCELREVLNNEDYRLAEILGIEFSSSSLQSKDDGYCYWSAGYPCLVRRIHFDASDFTPDQPDSEWRFRLAPFMLHGYSHTDEWVEASHIEPLTVSSWMLPGHGVALLWKPLQSVALDPNEEVRASQDGGGDVGPVGRL
jgi:hypothetical protein